MRGEVYKYSSGLFGVGRFVFEGLAGGIEAVKGDLSCARLASRLPKPGCWDGASLKVLALA